ncbi:MAG: alpha-2-macroglobulin, partial [Burkholderiales bacterium]|nr:alpha-2-macroglobulin [Burkholderiales bacterium]
NWVYDFTQDVPVGQQCSFTLKPEFKSVAGNSFSGKSSFQFNTGGPAVLRVSPYDGSNIEEEQAFILFQSAAATEASMRQHVYCEIEGVHERVPVKFLTGANREALLKEFAKNTDPARVSTVQCQQRFPADAAVRLVWEKGISTANGIAATHSQTFVYHSRPAFTATVNCERENANAACTPILPLTLNFSAGIDRKLAEQIVLKSGGSSIKPDIRKDNDEELISQVRFKPPFAEKAELTVELPSNLKDDSGRTLENAAQFPLKIKTAEFPPLAKFPAAPFGIVELNADATLPVTLRNVEQNLIARSANAKQAPGQLANLKVDSDAAIIEWISRLNKYHETTIKKNGVMVETRAIGLLEKEPNVQKLNLPASPEHATRPFEVIGIPFKDPGFYVLELESQKLGASLLGKRAPMFVRTSALVTNLAVHIKMGRENGAIWVTTLDNAKPVADADVQISDCYGKSVWKGKTTRNGVVIVPLTLDGACPQSDQANKAEPKVSGYFVSARKTDEKGRADMAFALSSWNNGIEAYRFNLPTDTSKLATVKAHTILDRSLFRAGETVSMKHIIRVESMNGLRLQKEELLPNRIRIIHQGSNQEFQFPLTWRDRNVAESTFAIPKQAKLGRYQIVLDSGKVKTDDDTKNASDDAEGEPYHENTYYTSSFRVEEFRLPLLQGRIVAPKGVQISPKNLPLDVQLNYINGGGAAGLPVHITSMLRSHAVSFPSYEQYSFDAYEENPEDQKIVANKIPVTLDKNGTGKTLIPHLPEIKRPQELLTEMTYADPNGEIQTMSTVTPLWPSAVIVGIKNEEWVSVKNKTRLTAIALDTTGKPLAGVPISISAVAKKNNSHRKRIVGGFYAYENVPTSQDLGKICSGKSDARGLLLCEVDLKESGNIELTATATDDNGQAAFAKTSMWVTGLGELWFEGENLDRMDVIPEKKQYQPGEIAKFQIRMPFRYATALIAVEREGVITTSVVKLNGRDPTVQLPIKAEYGPNIFVSVLAVRGRMREVPWYSFFTWGWKEPLNWWHEFREYQFPSATVDLAKPAFKYGIAEIAVGTTGHQLKVDVTSDKSVYPIRAVSKVNIQVTLPDGRPAAGAEVAVAAVDEALLELQPNDTWDVLPVMLQRRSYGVETATAQMQVIGKRHYGRKAVAAGGGGGKAPTRELFDTLLLWKPSVKLDAKGRAQVEVPLNDALTSFRIVAIAQSGESYFGKGSTSIRATQDLQLVSGLPPLIREGDHYTAMFTVRNTTTHGMSVSVQASASGAGVSDIAPLPVQTLQIPAGEAREANWSVLAPSMNGDVESQQVQWEVKAQEIATDANRQTKVEALPKDAIKVSQRLIAAVPVTVQQA